MSKQEKLPRLAIIGGTGKEGKGLAYRWAKAGYSVIIGSRTEEKAVEAASDLNKLIEDKIKIEEALLEKAKKKVEEMEEEGEPETEFDNEEMEVSEDDSESEDAREEFNGRVEEE